MSDKVTEILDAKRKRDEGGTVEETKFWLIAAGNNLYENYLELKLRSGFQTCFPYKDISWMNYDPEGAVDIELNGFHISIKGRGLKPLLEALKAHTVVWIKEADSEMQDNKSNSAYVASIIAGPTEMFEEKAEDDK
jgi:hypothetical protein